MPSARACGPAYDDGVDHVVPPGEDEPGSRTLSSSSASLTFLVTGSAEEAAYFAALRDRFGDERADLVQRARALRGHPRPLTGNERARLLESMAPVVRDIEACDALLPVIQDEAYEDVDDDFVSVTLWGADGTGMGIFIPAEGMTAAERVTRLAEQFQEWEIEELAAAGRPATWPECRHHPNSHPLEPVLNESTAAWRCPRTGQMICAIGALGTTR